MLKNVYFSQPTFGDHVLAIVHLNVKANCSGKLLNRRNWKNCNAILIIMENTVMNTLINYGPDWTNCNVQEHWNGLDNLGNCDSIDQLLPLICLNIDPKKKSEIPKLIRNKILLDF